MEVVVHARIIVFAWGRQFLDNSLEPWRIVFLPGRIALVSERERRRDMIKYLR
jgi:hypothetical protein